ncbi:MAG: hypothetical protein NZ551_05125 [Microscillaceae bacterium]|nr:hypothetical protein [Microscillaceae bacterium]MDW8460577.1 hypothetical protein [Cytophagales bacterium]
MLKKIVILFVALGLVSPFVLLSDLYPFFRLGMFAEPVQYIPQTEYFLIEYQTSHNQLFQPFQTAQMGFEDSHFQYILRYYVYQKQALKLLQILNQKQKKNNLSIKQWRIKRIVIHKKKQKKDTTLILNWQTP